MYCTHKALTSWTYYEVSLKDFDEHYDKLPKYYKKYSDENQDKQKLELIAEKTFEKDLTRQLMECEDHNRKINMARNDCIRWFIQLLLLYLVIIALSLLPIISL